jgi:uncharacterized SAM-binding protein YcdF (DUF218 family)
MNWVRRLIIGLVGLAALILLLMLGAGWFIAPQDDLRKADAIIVVSGGDTVKRTDEGVKLWKENWAPKLVLAGAAADRGTSNAAVMRARAVSQGVPADATIIEEQSATTKQNAEFLKPVLTAQNVRTAILVSSPYHTRRVKVTFEQVYGKQVSFIIHPAKDSRWARSSWWKQPDTLQITIEEIGKTFYSALGKP